MSLRIAFCFVSELLHWQAFFILLSLYPWGITRAQGKQYFRQMLEAYITWAYGYGWHYQMEIGNPLPNTGWWKLSAATAGWLSILPTMFLSLLHLLNWGWQTLPANNAVTLLCPPKFWIPELLKSQRLPSN